MMQRWIYLQRDTYIQRTQSKQEARKLLRTGWRIITHEEFMRRYVVVERERA